MAEIAVALVLPARAAVTIVTKVRKLLAADLGVRGANALAIDVVLPLATYGSSETVQAVLRALRRASSAPARDRGGRRDERAARRWSPTR